MLLPKLIMIPPMMSSDVRFNNRYGACPESACKRGVYSSGVPCSPRPTITLHLVQRSQITLALMMATRVHSPNGTGRTPLTHHHTPSGRAAAGGRNRRRSGSFATVGVSSSQGWSLGIFCFFRGGVFCYLRGGHLRRSR